MKERGPGAGLLGLGLLLLGSGCVDTSPLHYVAPGRDAGATTADAAPDSSVMASCRRCLTDQAGGCGAEATACTLDAKCPVALECLIESVCFRYSRTEDKLACATACFDRYDLKAATDPAIAILIQLNACTESGGACAGACSGG